MNGPDFFPHRVRPIADSLAGLEHGLQRLGCLLRAAALPCAAYVVIMAAMNQIHATYSLPYYLVFTKSEMEWWIASIVFVPFSAVMAWAMLRCLLSGAPTKALLPVVEVPTAVYGLAAAWMAANWLSAVIVRGLTLALYAPYARVGGDEAMPWVAMHGPRLLEVALAVVIGAGAAYLVATAAIAARPSRPLDRWVVAGVSAALLAVLAVDILRVHGGAMTEGAAYDAPEAISGPLMAGVGLLALALIIVVFRAGSFRFSSSAVLNAGGWRLAVLLLIASALANAAVFGIDTLARWAQLIDVRIDDPYLRQEFALRALAHHTIVVLRDVAFQMVLFSIAAQGFRRVLSATVADLVAQPPGAPP